MYWRYGLVVVTEVSLVTKAPESLLYSLTDHADVGGGSVRNDAPNALSNIPLRWMVRQAALCGSGIRFDEDALVRANISLQAGADGDLDELDKADAIQPIYDALKITPMWWALEIMPMTYVWQDKDGIWHKTFKYVVSSWYIWATVFNGSSFFTGGT